MLSLITGNGLADAGRPEGDQSIYADAGLLRVHASLHAAIGASFAMADASEAISLARRACDVPDGTAHEFVFRAIGATLDAIPGAERRSGFALLIVAAAASITPQVPVPDLG